MKVLADTGGRITVLAHKAFEDEARLQLAHRTKRLPGEGPERVV